MPTKQGRSKFGKWLKQQRQEEGVSQADLAKKLGVSQTTVSVWEKGRSEPTGRRREKVLALFSAQEEENALGDWLREKRKERGWTLAELAKRAGLSRQTIWNIEKGRIQNPSDQTMEKLEKVLGKLPPDERTEMDESATVEGLGKFTDFDPHDSGSLPRVPGIYVLYDISERPVYVGQGGDIGKRIRDHNEKFWFKSPIVETASYIEVGDAQLRRQIETILIRFLKSNAVINKKGVQND